MTSLNDAFQGVGSFAAGNTSGFRIDSMTRTHDDACEVNDEYRQSIGPGSYMTTNLYPTFQTSASAAYNNPTIELMSGYGTDRMHIDRDTQLRNEQTQEGRFGQRISELQSRPFATVPYMGGGRMTTGGSMSVLESKLQQSAWVRQDKSCGTISEEFLTGQFIPLVPHLQKHIQNPNNLIMAVAANGFVEGGLNTKLYMRDMSC